MARDEERERGKALARDRDIEDERRASTEPWGATCRSTRSVLTPPTGVVAPPESSKGFGFAYGGVEPGSLKLPPSWAKWLRTTNRGTRTLSDGELSESCPG